MYRLNLPLLLALGLLSGLPSALQSQTQLHLRGGINFSRCSDGPGELNLTVKPYYGYHVGLELNNALRGPWALQTALMLSNRGFTWKSNGGNNSTHLNYNVVELSPAISREVLPTMQLQFGAFGSYRLNEKTRYGETGTWTEPIFEVTEKYDAGLTGGLSLRKGRLSLKLDYQWGVMPLSSIEFINENGQTKHADLKTRNLRLGMTYLIVGKQ